MEGPHHVSVKEGAELLMETTPDDRRMCRNLVAGGMSNRLAVATIKKN
jgi:hypothetical protein